MRHETVCEDTPCLLWVSLELFRSYFSPSFLASCEVPKKMIIAPTRAQTPGTSSKKMKAAIAVIGSRMNSNGMTTLASAHFMACAKHICAAQAVPPINTIIGRSVSGGVCQFNTVGIAANRISQILRFNTISRAG